MKNKSKIVDIDKIVELCADCGNCLYYCPVYNAELTEPNSPRGKVNLIKAMYEASLNPTKQLDTFTYQCVLCGSCEYNCTKGVEFTDLMVEFRNRRSEGKKIPLIKKIILNIYSLSALKVAVKFLYLIPSGIRNIINILPRLRSGNSGLKRLFSGKKEGEYDILLFPGCMINLFYPEIIEKITGFLNSHGYSVVIPGKMKCCGAPYKTQGWERKFEKLKRKNSGVFSEYNFKYLVVPCGTGVKTFIKYYDIDGKKIFELTQFIYKFINDKAVVNDKILGDNKRITYHDPCHNLKSLGIKEEPRFFMKKFDERYIDDDSELCCGFGGLFSVNFSDTSKKILEKRVERLSETGASTVVTSCPGCYYQLQKNRAIDVKFFIDIFEENREK